MRIAALVLVPLAAVGCTCRLDRASCARDGDCSDGAVCLPDGECLPADVARRLGAAVGEECTVEGGREVGCDGDAVCRMGVCRLESDPEPDAGPDALCTEGTPEDRAPLFGGVETALPDGADAVFLRWAPAADETMREAVDYLVFVSEMEGVQDFASPALVVTGETTARVEGLSTGVRYFFVVRARDAAGQVECNTREAWATPIDTESCTDFGSAVQTLLDARCTHCHGGMNASAGLDLGSWETTTAGGVTGHEVVPCRPEQSLLYLKISMDEPPVGEQMPRGGPYLEEPEIDLVRRWIEQGASEHCPVDDRCADETPPAFGGVGTATIGPSGGTVELCWEPAVDDRTAAEAILYDVFRAAEPGAQDYASLPAVTTEPGATCAEVDGLAPSQEYCFVVLAHDEAGNRDANREERCVVAPDVECVEYEAVLQPLFDANCVRCHGGLTPDGGVDLGSWEGAVEATTPCASEDSPLWLVVRDGADPRMPGDGPPWLVDSEVEAIRRWIDEGANAECPGEACP